MELSTDSIPARSVSSIPPSSTSSSPVYSFYINTESGKLDDVETDPHVNVSFLDAKTTDWISISGKAVLNTDKSKVKKRESICFLLIYLLTPLWNETNFLPFSFTDWFHENRLVFSVSIEPVLSLHPSRISFELLPTLHWLFLSSSLISFFISLFYLILLFTPLLTVSKPGSTTRRMENTLETKTTPESPCWTFTQQRSDISKLMENSPKSFKWLRQPLVVTSLHLESWSSSLKMSWTYIVRFTTKRKTFVDMCKS